jgi:hypothetical protein
VLRRLLAASLLLALLTATAACGSDDAGDSSVEAPTTVPDATTTTAAPCTAALGSDFVAVEKHLTHGGHHLGQGYALDTPQGRYLIANVHATDDTLLASGLVWRIDANGVALSVTPETNGFDSLADVPAAEATPPAGLLGCQAAG